MQVYRTRANDETIVETISACLGTRIGIVTSNLFDDTKQSASVLALLRGKQFESFDVNLGILTDEIV